MLAQVQKTRAYLQEHGLEMLADDAVVKLK